MVDWREKLIVIGRSWRRLFPPELMWKFTPLNGQMVDIQLPCCLFIKDSGSCNWHRNARDWPIKITPILPAVCNSLTKILILGFNFRIASDKGFKHHHRQPTFTTYQINITMLCKSWSVVKPFMRKLSLASIAQLGERKTEDLEAPCSIHGRSTA